MKIRLLVDLPIGDEYKMFAGTELEVEEVKRETRNSVRWKHISEDGETFGIYDREAEIINDQD